jgi:tetratricopeptide (TPR) repeat protein
MVANGRCTITNCGKVKVRGGLQVVIFKCKMCGGDLEVDQSMAAVGTCQHCGSTMTLPKATDERLANLFNRANHYRRSSEFDKALKVYESVLNEDNANAEAYWGLVLCRYGIEYVEDPKTGQRIPTCHRAQKTSIFLVADYKQALEYADSDARQIYEQEAKVIDDIQKQILSISAQEEPYDIFICYKGTSETGSRTKDSVMAQDIYHHLTEEGYKVFFSRISLEDKLGSAFEPYIFAALNSSRVMIVVATNKENVNAAWIKNEWSRYLALINKGEKKTLIPVYRDMDPYDLPEEFGHLQAQDMGRLGFMQDLVRGAKKIIESGLNESISPDSFNLPKGFGIVNTKSLLERAFICLEDGEWVKADDLLEQVLNLEPRSAKAYIGKLMAELKVQEECLLAEQNRTFNDSGNYKKALRFADQTYKAVIINYDALAVERVNTEQEYQRLINNMQSCEDEDGYLALANELRTIHSYKDVESLIDECLAMAENLRLSREAAEERLRIVKEKALLQTGNQLDEDNRIKCPTQRLKAKKFFYVCYDRTMPFETNSVFLEIRDAKTNELIAKKNCPAEPDWFYIYEKTWIENRGRYIITAAVNGEIEKVTWIDIE